MPLPPESSKRFLAVLGFSFAVEGALYSAVTPILPLLARRFGLSDSQTGVLLSGYSAGLIAGSLLGFVVLKRVNARTAAVAALTMLAASTALFAWSNNYDIVLTTRLVQGISGGAMWTACISWLLGVWPIERRGEALGLSVGPAVIGTVAGPAIGTVAVDLGVRLPYSVVAALCLAAATWLLRIPRPARVRLTDDRASVTTSRRRIQALLGAGVATVAGGLIGLINLAGPVVLADIGAAERTSGIAFLVAALLTVVAARPVGALVDRVGAPRTTLVGLLLTGALLPVFGAGFSTWLTAAALVLLLIANNLCYISAGTMLTREGERAGWPLYFVTALAAMAWGVGETSGAVLAGVGLDTVGALWAATIGAVLTVVTAFVVRLRAVSSGAPKSTQHDAPQPTGTS